MSKELDHRLEWNDRLQEWLDGELDAASAAAVQTHLAKCEDCSETLAALEQLDEALHEELPRLTLDEAFDRRLLAQIEIIDETKRAEARRRAEQEAKQQLNALARGWRRTWAFVVPGVVAGVAIAFALSAWLDASGVTGTLVAEGAAELGGGAADFIRLGVTAVIGAGLGLLVAPWLARLSE